MTLRPIFAAFYFQCAARVHALALSLEGNVVNGLWADDDRFRVLLSEEAIRYRSFGNRAIRSGSLAAQLLSKLGRIPL